MWAKWFFITGFLISCCTSDPSSEVSFLVTLTIDYVSDANFGTCNNDDIPNSFTWSLESSGYSGSEIIPGTTNTVKSYGKIADVRYDFSQNNSTATIQQDLPANCDLISNLLFNASCPGNIETAVTAQILVKADNVKTGTANVTNIGPPYSTTYYHFTVSCSVGFELPDCTKCTDFPGRYTCNNETHLRDCAPGFYSHGCDVYCLPVTEQYNCDEQGARICLGNWHGKDCDIYCVTNTTTHYDCDKDTGGKICHQGYYGLNCNTQEPKPSGIDYQTAFIVAIVLAGIFLLMVIGVVVKFLWDRRNPARRPPVSPIEMGKVPDLASPIPRATNRYTQNPSKPLRSSAASAPTVQSNDDDGDFEDDDTFENTYDSIGDAKNIAIVSNSGQNRTGVYAIAPSVVRSSAATLPAVNSSKLKG